MEIWRVYSFLCVCERSRFVQYIPSPTVFLNFCSLRTTSAYTIIDRGHEYLQKLISCLLTMSSHVPFFRLFNSQQYIFFLLSIPCHLRFLFHIIFKEKKKKNLSMTNDETSKKKKTILFFLSTFRFGPSLQYVASVYACLLTSTKQFIFDLVSAFFFVIYFFIGQTIHD